jgi:hypothetical protein
VCGLPPWEATWEHAAWLKVDVASNAITASSVYLKVTCITLNYIRNVER